MKNSGQRILIDPAEILIESLDLFQPHTETITLTNTLSVPVTISLKPHTPTDRKYKIHPSTLKLSPNDPTQIQITTTLLKNPVFGFYIRDIISLTSEYFTEKLYISIKPKSFQKPEANPYLSSKKIEKLEHEIRAYDEEIESLHEKFLEKSQAENEKNRLSKENSELKQALEEANRGSFFSQKMSEMYKGGENVEQLVEVRLMEERERNERKDKKVLEILRQRDKVIEEKEKCVRERDEKLAQLHAKLVESRKELQGLKEVEQSTMELGRTVQDQQEVIMDLKREISELKPYKAQVSDLNVQLSTLKSALKHLQEENRHFKNREEGILALSTLDNTQKSRQAQVISEKDQIILELQSKLASQTCFIDSLISNLPNKSHQELLSRILSLQNENRLLCSQFADSPNKPSEFPQIFQSNEQLSFELAVKNREILSLQSQILTLQKHCSLEEYQKMINAEQLRNQELGKENEELKALVKGLEGSNKDLQGQIGNLLQGVNSEGFIQSVASQTQLVSRLNGRVLALKEREDLALKKLAESEEAVKELRRIVEGKYGGIVKCGKGVENVAVQTEGGQVSQSGLEWDELEKYRYERKIAELNKEIVTYQTKYYTKSKEIHTLTQELTQNETKSVQEISKLQKEAILSQTQVSDLNSQILFQHSEIKDLQAQSSHLLTQKKSLELEIDSLHSHYKSLLSESESTLSFLKLEISLKDSCIQERTSQVAILMDKIENHPNTEDLSIQVSHFKAIEGSLKREILEITSKAQEYSNQLAQELKKSSNLSQKVENLQGAVQALEKDLKLLEHEKSELNGKLKEKEVELSLIKVSLNRVEESEKENKEKINGYLKRISQLQQSYAGDLVREREGYREELVRVLESMEPFDLELQFSRPVVQALNQLALAVKNGALDSEDLVNRMKEILLKADKTLFDSERKVRELEFLSQNSEVFRFLDSENVNALEKFKQQVFDLNEELKIWKNPKNMPNPALYTSRIKSLEQDLESRNALITHLESDLFESKKNIASLTSTLHSQTLKNKSEELHSYIAEKNLLQRAEEDLKKRLKSRDEEIRGYLDSHLTKILVESQDSVKILELTREISSMKMLINDLEYKLKAEAKNNETLQRAFSELSEAIYQCDKKEVVVNINQNSEVLLELQQKSHELHKVKEAFEHRKEENAFLQQKITEFKKEVQGLRDIQGNFDWKCREKQMEAEIKELKEKHKREIQVIKMNSQDLLQDKLEELENKMGSELNCGKNEEFLQIQERNEELNREIQFFASEKEKIYKEFQEMNGKFKNSLNETGKLREELEIYKEALKEGAVLRVEEVKTGKKVEKRLVLEKSKSSVVFRLVRALLSTKLSESELTKKLKSYSERQVHLQSSLDTLQQSHSQSSKSLEKLIKYLKLQKVPLPDLSVPSSPLSDEDLITQLKEELAELRSYEEQRLKDLVPLSLITDPVNFPGNEFGDLMESIIFLTNQISANESKKDPTIEKVQRTVIKTLHQALQVYLKPNESISSLLEYKPTNKDDVKLWYIELLDTQCGQLSESISKLINFTNKTAVEVSGNLLTSGQFKGAALELAQNVKNAANELELLKNVCFMIRTDLSDLQSKESGHCSDYKERAYLAEALKRKLEEEILKLKMENSYKLAEMQEFVNGLQDEKEKIENFQESNERVLNENQKELVRCKGVISKLESENKQLGEKYAALDKTCSDLLETKEVLAKRNDKLVKDHKSRISDLQDQIQSKEKLLLESQKQVKILQESQSKILQDSSSIKKQNQSLKSEVENLKLLKDTEKELKQMKVTQAQSEDYKEDIRRLLETQKKEMEQVMNVVAGLEEKNKELRHKYKKAKNYITNKVKVKEEDTDLLKHTFNAQILTIKNESRERIKELTGQVSTLQVLLKEKMNETDQEAKRRLENDEKNKVLYSAELDSQRKIAVLEEKLKAQKELYDHETSKLLEELKRCQNDHEKLIMKLQDNFTSAEILADFISKSEQEKRHLDSHYKVELSSLQRKEKEKEVYIETLKTKLSDLTEKSKDFEQKTYDLHTMTKEIEDMKFRIAELNNTKVQQRGKIKELESKIREFEVLKEADEHNFALKLDEIRRESKIVYEEFEKTSSKYEGIIEGLKEQYHLELRRMKCPKKALESVDFMFQIAKRDGMIKALKKELRMQSVKKVPKVGELKVNEETVKLQNQVFKLKAQVKGLETQLMVAKDEAVRLKGEIDMGMKIHEEVIEKDMYTRKEIAEIEKRHKEEIRGLLEEYNRLLHTKASH